ncbi:DNA polymerase delta catalytic subunit [Zancudomyces culisetae]|uniref:DNA polymerase n=1 Tax=Zancudomyces culisetae TaxID=1213189 RepID=A0A1R1PTN2_ZANCU|nr:DNA polymerase delta catalytic subunit [Zancudomyces culisetae]|eukprot:OMH84304.1 DNA polymerase delta catalytic subunit [Zancudomyces culisetae]
MEIIDYYDVTKQKMSLRMFGVTDNENSVMCEVYNFLGYFYVPVPYGFNSANTERVRQALNEQMSPENGGAGAAFHGNSTKETQAVVRIETMNKESLYGYNGGKKVPFWKIFMRLPKLVTPARRLFERGVEIPTIGNYVSQTFESNLEYVVRFLVDCKIVGSGWVELPAGKYRIRPEEEKKSLCQIEVEIDWNDIIPHEPIKEWSRFAPLRILSFDIECSGRKGIFPEPQHDAVIQIAGMLTRQGEAQPFVRALFTLGGCSQIPGCQLIQCKTEEELLTKFAEFLQISDPDIVIGYNTSNFDFPYILDRAAHLGVNAAGFLGRVKESKSVAKDARFSSKAYGTRDRKDINVDGRAQLDILQAIIRDHKLRSYTLNSVSAHFLGEQKEDVPHSIITDLQNGNDDTRRRLGVYCLKDAYLPQRLMDKLMLLVNYIEMARVTGVPFNYLLTRGQQIRVISQLYRSAVEQDFVIPAMDVERGSGTEQYEGAIVIEPMRGYYDVPIATLDFASLYPSIMIAHNLCYTTLVSRAAIERLGLVEGVDYEVTPTNDCFIKSPKRKGLLPYVLEQLLLARKVAKKDMANEKDPFKVRVLNGRQLALKIVANSVYGFTGATIGRLPCLQISASVTAYGRDMIEATKNNVEKTFTKENGYENDAVVIYGDTDSVMVKFGKVPLEEAMRLGKIASELITKEFIAPIKLEFEKVYFPYLLINKKRYAGLYWTNPQNYDKLDTKGLETVRRDNCPLVQVLIENCLHLLLINRDVDGAVSYAKRTISNLLQNKVDLSQLIITKQLSKTDYAGKQAHVELAERMRKRDPGSAPQVGDRVAYVIIKAAKGAAAYERAEDPIYVLNNGLPIDTHYYLENQLVKPLTRIFEPILTEKVGSLFSGDHTRSIHLTTPNTGALMRFAVRSETCLGCRVPLPPSKKSAGSNAVCVHCLPKLPEIYFANLQIANACQTRYARLWTECQRCQSIMHEDVVCSNSDCPIFYMRTKAQHDNNQQIKVMKRFDLSW